VETVPHVFSTSSASQRQGPAWGVLDRGAMTIQTVPFTRAAERPARADHRLRNAALRDVLTVSPGVVPFGVMLGVTAIMTGTGAPAALLGAVLVYGGSAQLATLTALHVGAGVVAAVASGTLVSSRILLYGAALEPRFRGQPLWFRLLAPQFVLDQTYLSATGRPQISGADFRRYWAWLGTALLVVWTAAVATGLLLGPLLPPLPHLSLVGTALFIAMLVPRLVSREALVGATVSVVVAIVVAHTLPALGILGGAAAGVAAAVLVSGRVRS